MIEAGFWFLSGFFVASWLSWRAQAKQRAKAIKSFQVAKTEILELLDKVRDTTEIRITILDRDGEIESDSTWCQCGRGKKQQVGIRQ